MTGYVDIAFWVVFLGGVAMGWAARSAVVWYWKMDAEQQAIYKARANHPSSQPQHVWLVDDEQLRLFDD